MSILSEQCGDLRSWAMWVRDHVDHVCGNLVAREMEKAADTIWRLRNQNLELHDQIDELRDQNDQLREEITDLWPRAAFTMHKTCKLTWIAELGELGIEVTDTETSEC